GDLLHCEQWARPDPGKTGSKPPFPAAPAFLEIKPCVEREAFGAYARPPATGGVHGHSGAEPRHRGGDQGRRPFAETERRRRGRDPQGAAQTSGDLLRGSAPDTRAASRFRAALRRVAYAP